MTNATPERALAAATSPAAKGGDTAAVLVHVEAETAEGHCFTWEGSCPLAAPLQQIASAWAHKHSVPVDAVGFEAESGELVDQTKTPSDYGWMEGQQVRLKCFPASDEFAEAEGDEANVEIEEPPAVQTKDAVSAASRQQVCRTSGKQAAAGSSPAIEAKGAKREATKDVTPEAKAKKSKVAEASSQASNAAVKGVKKSGGGEGNDGPPPGDNEPIEYQQNNPKQAGKGGHERYEKYKKAKTIKEALELGAVRGDIKYDWQRGFYKRK
eukprot:TRINITY_DN81086_c0_g1_i1.p1 TRINITY_DN81086_c0_g1~~TRINITY_DN81086_c0_g1_i1.p1  ORF type:complete len:282 (-),score=64.51 TRINITY_DN81086_c0_g1_i1:115-918(-)